MEVTCASSEPGFGVPLALCASAIPVRRAGAAVPSVHVLECGGDQIQYSKELKPRGTAAQLSLGDLKMREEKIFMVVPL